MKQGNYLLTMGQEGRLCRWDCKKLDEPLLFLDIYENDTKSEIAQMEIIPMDFVTDEPINRKMYIATFENSVYQIDLLDNELKLHSFQNVHDAPVSGVAHLNFKNFAKQIKDSLADTTYEINPSIVQNFLVTGSFDWKLKIFPVENLETPVFTLVFHKDFISAVASNPVNPYLLASADSDGVLAVWNLQKKSTAPVFNWKSPSFITRLKWSANGDRLAVCDCKGHVHVISLRKSLVKLKEEIIKQIIENEFEISAQ